MPLSNKIKQEGSPHALPKLLISWRDDDILEGTEAELINSLAILESEGKELGFTVKTSTFDEMYVLVAPNHEQVRSKY